MKQFILFLLIGLPVCTYCREREYIIDDFSVTRYFRICTNISDGEMDGTVVLYEKKDDKVLLESEFSGLMPHVIDTTLVVDGRLSVRHQTMIRLMDFNFDGKQDILIQEGPFGTYGVPTYHVFLAEGSRYVYNEDFSALTHGYSFELDGKNKKITTTDVQGIVYWGYSEYKVVNNKLKLLASGSKTLDPNGIFRTERTQIGKNKTESVYFEGNGNLSFELEMTGKKVVLCSSETNYLNYALLLKESDLVEAYYPQANADPGFSYQAGDGEETITFSAPDALYTIYESENRIGILVNNHGRISRLPGNKSTQKGSIKDLLNNPNILNLQGQEIVANQ